MVRRAWRFFLSVTVATRTSSQVRSDSGDPLDDIAGGTARWRCDAISLANIAGGPCDWIRIIPRNGNVMSFQARHWGRMTKGVMVNWLENAVAHHAAVLV